MNNIQSVKYRETLLETVWAIEQQFVCVQSFVSGCRPPIKERKRKKKRRNLLKGFDRSI
jgi:hypothetical protein